MKILFTFFYLLVTALPILGSAKGGGNGGVSVVCRNSKGTIISAEILDLFEGKNKFQLSYPINTNDPDTIVNMAQLKMISNPKFLSQFRDYLDEVRANLVFLPKGIGPHQLMMLFL